ncbi:hypothetical protein PAF17_19810 [Paracoccus sp. Z330]|uniref:Uncharacterized protein n=1 Tax=Paracoccus onchidii TaxID=3017813 RepID=A0ABT4ZK75_9RHOB|nr:hypothetical protein [Paracoccus onchidii]MDB6179697.1 hypothetical protein [Paracoccus onchidii]
MWKYLIGAIVGLMIGAVGAVFTMGAAVGAGAGVGLAAGICSMAKAAQDLGVMTAEQVDEAMTHAASLFGSEMSEGTKMIEGGAARCDTVLDELRKVAS